MRSVKAARSRVPGLPATQTPHCFGAHLSIAGGMHNAAAEAIRLGMNAVQVFVKNQRQWRAAPLQADDVERWHEMLATPGFGPAVAHATYLINLASGDGALWAKSRRAFAEELHRCEKLAIRYLVVHPGAAGEQKRSRGLKRVATALDCIFGENPDLTTMPLLETTAGQGTSLGTNFEELGEIIGHLTDPSRVGICIDTCHVFAAGYDIRDAEQYEAMIATAKHEVGLDRIRCWHFNDSKTDVGSHVDRHEHIGHGHIGTAGFRNILADPRVRGVPMILETPKGQDPKGKEWDRVNLNRLRRIAGRAQQQVRI